MEDLVSKSVKRSLSCGHWFLRSDDLYASNGYSPRSFSLVIHFPRRVFKLPFGFMIIPRRVWHIVEKDLKTDNYMTAMILAKQD